MKKSIILLLIAVLTVTVFLSACAGDSSVYVDPAGHTYIAATDEEGNTVLNDDGLIVVYETEGDGTIVTNSSGEPVTKGTAFPEQIVKGDVVQTPTYTVTLPSGWKADTGLVGNFYRKNSTASVNVSIIETNKSLEEYSYIIHDTLETIVNDPDGTSQFSYTEDSLKIVSANTEAKVYRTSAVDQDGTKILQEIIYFENAGNLYKMLYQANEADYSEEDFVSFYTAITYKDVLYY